MARHRISRALGSISSVYGMRSTVAEVRSITLQGIWLIVRGEEFFLSFDEFPWFKKAPVNDVQHVIVVTAQHLRWPELDVDLELDSIRHPGRYSLIAREPRPKPRRKARR